VLIVGGLAAVGVLAYFALRQTTVATTRSIVDGAVSQATPPVVLSYAGDSRGRALTAAEEAALRMYDAQLDPSRLVGGLLT
jgi:uncharacterized membrane protein YebE (DUF533 family)